MVDVLVDGPGPSRTLSYLVPENLAVASGDAVHLPYGHEERHGLVLGTSVTPTMATRDLISVFGQRVDPLDLALAERIAAWPPEAVQAAKRAIDAGIYAAEPQFITETNEFRSLINARGHIAPMQRFLDAGGQTREGETTRMDAIIDAMRNPDMAGLAD